MDKCLKCNITPEYSPYSSSVRGNSDSDEEDLTAKLAMKMIKSLVSLSLVQKTVLKIVMYALANEGTRKLTSEPWQSN
jgi:hypothetical protein